IRFMWTYGFSECNGTDASIYVSTVVPSPEFQRQIVNLGCGGTYYLQGDCAYAVGIPAGPRGRGSIPADIPLASFSFQQPVRTYTFTDNWINQCSALE